MECGLISPTDTHLHNKQLQGFHSEEYALAVEMSPNNMHVLNDLWLHAGDANVATCRQFDAPLPPQNETTSLKVQMTTLPHPEATGNYPCH